MKKRMRNNRNSGFTMVEMLATVAIIVILLGISAVSVIHYIDILKITELDNAARDIYMAAENRAVLLSASQQLDNDLKNNGKPTTLIRNGNSDGGESDVALFAEEPGTAKTAENLYYVSKASIGTDLDLLPNGVIDPTLREGDFYIVYDLNSGSVTDVFYAENAEALETLVKANITFEEFYKKWAKDRSIRLDLKSDETNSNKTLVGWYDGEAAQGGNFLPDISEKPLIIVIIKNEEKLTVTVEYTVPGDGILEVWLGDVELNGHIDLTEVTDPNRKSEPLKNETTVDGVTYTHYICTWVLDSLQEGEGKTPLQFKGLHDGTKGVTNIADLILGGDFKVKATVKPASGSSFKEASDEDVSNSLFEYWKGEGGGKGSNGPEAHVAYLRHLQNLSTDTSANGYDSGVGNNKTSAVQTADIFGGSDNSTYQDWTFYPISNDNITSYKGKYNDQNFSIRNLTLRVAGTTSVGLFSEFKGETLDNIRMVNTKVEKAGGASVGALAGKTKNVTITGCYVYWENDEVVTNLESTLGKGGGASGYKFQLQGATVGGLVGTANGTTTITGSLAATLINGTSVAGGLVGQLDGGSIMNSYADCYLTGSDSNTTKVAGLVGNLTGYVKLTNCYSAGFILGVQSSGFKAAGLCLGEGKTETHNVYTVMRYFNSGGSSISDSTLGSNVFNLTEKQGSGDSFSNTYFLGTDLSIGMAKGKTYDEMTDHGPETGKVNFAGIMGDGFAWKVTSNSHPYNLREDLTLDYYSFPGLANLPHYGDWGAQFKDPSLVYYEHYNKPDNKGNQWGISGGNARTLVVNNLQDTTILSDGYAVAFLKSDVAKANATNVAVKYTYSYYTKDGIKIQSETYRTYNVADDLEGHSTSWGDAGALQTAYFIILPDELVYSNYAQDCYYRYLKFELYYCKNSTPIESDKVATGEHFFNPHFAETVKSYDGDAVSAGTDWTTKMQQSAMNLSAFSMMGQIRVRTPRHLYDLSHFSEYYKQSRYSFQQVLDLDYATYDWRGMYETTGTDDSKSRKTIFELTGGESIALTEGKLAPPYGQQPIGRKKENGTLESFSGTYDGGCHIIKNVVPLVNDKTSITQRQYAGLFGYSSGALRNIVYQMDPDYQLTASLSGSSTDPYVYVGALAGASTGTIYNCAVSGVNLKAAASSMQLFEGGLVGLNTGTVQNSAAEVAMLSADCMQYTSAYIGGLVGQNSGPVNASYAVGRISAEVDSTVRTARICGFVGWNNAAVTNSYAAVDLQSTGGAVEAHGFCGERAGTQSGTGYLDQGNFTYRDKSYNAFYKTTDTEQAESVTYARLSGGEDAFTVSGMSTTGEKGDTVNSPQKPGKDDYPYPATVKNAKNQYVHYGEWPESMNLGKMGVFYWEKLVIDGDEQNATYHIYALTVDPDADSANAITRQTTLSETHDDGGVVKDYGYGYYNIRGVETQLTASNIAYINEKTDVRSVLTTTGAYLKNSVTLGLLSQVGNGVLEPVNYLGEGDGYQGSVKQKLEDQMPDFEFWPWNSYHEVMNGSENSSVVPGLAPVMMKNQNGSSVSAWTQLDLNTCTFALSQRDDKTGKTANAEFIINPHFAASMSVKSAAVTENNKTVNVDISKFNTVPGKAGNPFQVRNGAQLQNINWHDMNRVDGGVGYQILSKDKKSVSNTIYTAVKRFPYLSDTDNTKEYTWTQTHDIDWIEEGNTYKNVGETVPGVFYSIAQTYVQNKLNGNGGYSQEQGPLSGWFAGSYDGDYYIIKNLNVGADYPVNCAGMFGATVGATLKNIVLYSEEGNNAITVTSGNDQYRWYAGGVLVGLAQKNGNKGEISNCAVAGYTIKDEATLRGQKGAAIGGLVGMTDITLTGCVAVTDIEVNKNYTTDAGSPGPLRIGGLVGSTVASVTDCYTGGTISISKTDTKVFAGRIIGGIGMEVLEEKTATASIENCYSYLILPSGTNSNVTLYSIGGTGGTVGGSNGSARTLNPNVAGKTYKTNYYLEGTGTGTGIGEKVSHPQLAGKVSMDGQQLTMDANGKYTNDIYAVLGGRYSQVTTTVGNLSASGRYSRAPKTRLDLQGLDYPFPTLITVGENHVHYGEWPLNGILRDKGGQPVYLDMFAGLENPNSKSNDDKYWNPGYYEETLKLSTGISDGEWDVELVDGESETDTDGSVWKKNDFVKAKIDQNGNLTIIALKASTTPVTVTVTYGDLDPLKITVYISDNVTLTPNTVSVFPNDTVVVTPLEHWGARPGEQLYDVPLDGTLTNMAGDPIADLTAETVYKTDDDTEPKEVTGIKLSRTDAEDADQQVLMDVTYDYTQEVNGANYTAERKTNKLTVNRLDLPKGLWTKKDSGWIWTIDFKDYAVTIDSDATTVPEGTTCVSMPTVSERQITLTKREGVVFPEDGVKLAVSLTMDGLEHNLTVTVPKPIEEELIPTVEKVGDNWTIDFGQYSIERATWNNTDVKPDGSTVTLTEVAGDSVTLTVILTNEKGLRQQFTLTVVLPKVENPVTGELVTPDGEETGAAQWTIDFSKYGTLEGPVVTDPDDLFTAVVGEGDKSHSVILALKEEATFPADQENRDEQEDTEPRKATVTLTVTLIKDSQKQKCVLTVVLQEPVKTESDALKNVEGGLADGLEDTPPVAAQPPDPNDSEAPDWEDDALLPEPTLEPAAEPSDPESPDEEDPDGEARKPMGLKALARVALGWVKLQYHV